MKYSSLLLAVAMLLPATASAAFPDVDAAHENGRAIEYLQEKGIMTGYPNGTFGPDRHLSRAELMKILVESSVGTPLPSYARQCFPDIEVDSWYAAYVCYAKDQGWVSGYPDGTFRPSRDVSMVEAVKMLVNARGYALYTDRAEEDDDWFASYMETALVEGIISSETRYAMDPGENYDDAIPRKRIAEFIYRALWKEGRLSMHISLNPDCSVDEIVSLEVEGGPLLARMRSGTNCTLATDWDPLLRVSKHSYLYLGLTSAQALTVYPYDIADANVVDGKAYFSVVCECDGGRGSEIFELDLRTGLMRNFISDPDLISDDYRYFIAMTGEGMGEIRVFDTKQFKEKIVVSLDWPFTLAKEHAGYYGIGGGFTLGKHWLEGHTLHYNVYNAHEQKLGEAGTYDYQYGETVDLDAFFAQ